jgi:hypothetical protein
MHSPEGEGEYEEEGMVGMSEDEVVPAEGLDGDVPEGEDIDLEGAEGGEGEGEGEGEVESMGEGEGVGEIAGAGAAAGVGADAGGAQSEGKGKGKAKAQVSDTVISSSWVLLARPTANGLEHLGSMLTLVLMRVLIRCRLGAAERDVRRRRSALLEPRQQRCRGGRPTCTRARLLRGGMLVSG